MGLERSLWGRLKNSVICWLCFWMGQDLPKFETTLRESDSGMKTMKPPRLSINEIAHCVKLKGITTNLGPVLPGGRLSGENDGTRYG